MHGEEQRSSIMAFIMMPSMAIRCTGAEAGGQCGAAKGPTPSDSQVRIVGDDGTLSIRLLGRRTVAGILASLGFSSKQDILTSSIKVWCAEFRYIFVKWH